MSHTYQLSRQFQQEPIKTGGIVINPEDAHPHMRDQIHMDPKSGTYAVLKPHHSDKTFTRELQYEFTRPRTEKGLVKTGGILINPEDALPSMRHHIHTDSRSGSTYALLKPAKENLRNSDPITRRFSCEFTRSSMREDPIKTGGIIINPEDALPSMRHQLHTDPRSGSTYALLKPQIHTRKFSYEFTRPSVGQDPVKTGGIIIRPEDALESMRHSIHVDPRSHSTYANLKPWSQTHGSSSDASMPMEGQRRFSYEFTRDVVKGDRVKTGGIVIRPEDALPHMRDQIRVHPRSHSTYANLKPWRQSQGDSGIIDTRSSLDEMGSHVDSLITRSRNILSESGVYSIPSLGYLGEMGSSYVA